MTTTTDTAELVADLFNEAEAYRGKAVARHLQAAADRLTALERERDEAQLAASVIEGICNELDIELTASQAEVERLKEALKQIAAYDDTSASATLAASGSFGSFDEPGSVEIARRALEPAP